MSQFVKSDTIKDNFINQPGIIQEQPDFTTSRIKDIYTKKITTSKYKDNVHSCKFKLFITDKPENNLIIKESSPQNNWFRAGLLLLITAIIFTLFGVSILIGFIGFLTSVLFFIAAWKNKHKYKGNRVKEQVEAKTNKYIEKEVGSEQEEIPVSELPYNRFATLAGITFLASLILLFIIPFPWSMIGFLFASVISSLAIINIIKKHKKENGKDLSIFILLISFVLLFGSLLLIIGQNIGE